MPPKKTTVLAVDNDVYILRMLKRILELEGYEVAVAGDGEKSPGHGCREKPRPRSPGRDDARHRRLYCLSANTRIFQCTYHHDYR